MSSPPDFPTSNDNTSIVSDGYDAQLAPPPEIKAAPDLEGVVHDNPSGANLSSQITSDMSAPGYTDIGPKNPSEVDEESANATSNKSAPGYTGIGPKNPSEVDEESANATSSKSAPGYTGISPKNPSEVDGKSANTNQKEIVGNSLAGKRFKDVNPTPYY